jgi:hypothetical protein
MVRSGFGDCKPHWEFGAMASAKHLDTYKAADGQYKVCKRNMSYKLPQDL